METSYDIVIVGGGPAGSACALALRDSGLRVAVLDKKKFPRDKTCGDAIPGGAMKVLANLVPDLSSLLDEQLSLHQTTSSAIYTPSGRSVKVDWVQKAYNMPRLDFDDFLMQLVKKQTNVEVIEGEACRSVSTNNQMTIETDQRNISCKLVIGCDGANSAVSRAFDLVNATDLDRYFGLRAYHTNVDCPPDTNEFFVLKNLPQAYFWIFPLEDGLYNVGLGFNKKLDQRITKERFLALLDDDPVLAPKFSGAKLTSDIKGFRLPMGGKRAPISGNRFMVCGDAANLIDPLQGHGIDKAMISGQLAAQQALRCFTADSFTATTMAQYDNEVHTAVGKELRRNLMIMKRLHKNPWLLELLIRFGQNERVKRFLQKKLL